MGHSVPSPDPRFLDFANTSCWREERPGDLQIEEWRRRRNVDLRCQPRGLEACCSSCCGNPRRSEENWALKQKPETR